VENLVMVTDNQMMQPDPAQQLQDAPLVELLTILLRQFKGLLAAADIPLTENEIRSLARDLSTGQPPSDKTAALHKAFVDIVEKSVQVLSQWDFTFEQSLNTDMNAVPGWETTAEFLEIANDKGNAELRISSGAALLAALGDWRYAPYLLAAIEHDPVAIETVVAHRLLSQASGVGRDVDDWTGQVRRWLDTV
jgi:hypothetical protein